MEVLRWLAVVLVVMLVIVNETQALKKRQGRSIANHRHTTQGSTITDRLASPFTNLKIAAFNVRVFGKTKMSSPGVADVLVKIILRYDIILIMEIRDSSETAIVDLLNRVNIARGSTTSRRSPTGAHVNKSYNIIVSPRLGRTSSKEQYAFMYRTDKVSVVRSYVYEDGDETTLQDTFEREPFIVQFRSNSTKIKDFALAAIHTSPSSAPAEVDSLVDVYDDVISKWSINDVILLGDFNSACSYMSDFDWKRNRLFNDKRFKWIIGDEVDTTVGRSSVCAYDRLVIAGSVLTSAVVPGSADRFPFDSEFNITNDLALKVSDHYPIEMELYSQGLSDALQSVQEVTEYKFYSKNPPSLKAEAIYPIRYFSKNKLLTHGFVAATTKSSSRVIATISNTKTVFSEQDAYQALSLIYSCWSKLLTKDQVNLALHKLVNKEYLNTPFKFADVKFVCRNTPPPVECWVALEM